MLAALSASLDTPPALRLPLPRPKYTRRRAARPVVIKKTRAPTHGKPWTTRKGDSTGKYSGVLDCFVKTARNDGPLAFYNGFIPNFARLG